jgi:hypothetical protein
MDNKPYLDALMSCMATLCFQNNDGKFIIKIPDVLIGKKINIAIETEDDNTFIFTATEEETNEQV